jgi:hypothetical protein
MKNRTSPCLADTGSNASINTSNQEALYEQEDISPRWGRRV